MTLEQFKLISEICTPFLVLFFGIFLLRKTEQIKSSIIRKSDFSVKWATEFFEVYRSFINDTEEVMNLLFHLQTADNERSAKIVDNLSEVFISLSKSELHLSIILLSFPKIKSDIDFHTNNIIETLRKMIETKEGNFDELKKIVAKFSDSAREVHKRLLEY